MASGAPWRWNGDQGGGYVIDGVGDSFLSYVRGETTGGTLVFDVESQHTNATARERYQSIRATCEVAGEYVSGETETNQPWYRLRVRRDTNASPLVKLEPEDNLNGGMPGVWGLVESYDDSTVVAGSDYALDVSLLVLARTDQVPTRQEVRDKFSGSLIP
jgi:hypothetical protein